MNCERMRELMVEHVEGVLGADEAEGARVHLKACGGCGALFEEVRRGFAALDAWGDEDLPAEAWERMRARLPGEPSPAPARAPWRILRAAALPFAAGLGTAAAALLFLSSGGKAPATPLQGPSGDSPLVAREGAVPAAAREGAVPGVVETTALRTPLKPGERALLFDDPARGVVRWITLPPGVDPGRVTVEDEPRVVPVSTGMGVR